MKSNMKRNSTWGLMWSYLLQPYYYKRIFGYLVQTWVISGWYSQVEGAKLIDTVESPPVNIAGSIYINHNGVHYEPILRVDLGV